MTKLHEKITKQKEYRLNEREKIFKLTKLTTKWLQDVTNQLYHVTKQLKDRYDILKIILLNNQLKKFFKIITL